MTNKWEDMKRVQPIAMKMLENSIKKNRLTHAYLFDGMRGTGKKDAGKLIAKSLFCEAPLDGCHPCEACVNCRRIEKGIHPDVHLVEPDGLSIKKQQIQALQDEFKKTGVESNKKLYMIIHADRMTSNAANSLLKFLEEPHAETTAILITEQLQKMLPTIISRCQTIHFKPLQANHFVEQLISQGVDRKKAPLISQLTNDLEEGIALSQDDWFAQAQKIVIKLYEVIKKKPLEALVALQDDWFSHFKEKDQINLGLDLFLLLFKDILYVQLGKEEQLVNGQVRKQLATFALQTSGRRLTEQMSSILEAKRRLQANMNPQLLMEQLVLKLQEGSSFV
ncbi:DNA polymerase III subunit delta' [Bacillaceae bacterium Marseille-Q3522]|nr:DNA polymerase III subunit delta' [Bacillaceae bacterium Marseille-Q3522]